MLSHNPDATPIWVLMIYSAVTVFGYPRIKRFVSKYVSDSTKQSLYSFILWLVVGAVVVTLSIAI